MNVSADFQFQFKVYLHPNQANIIGIAARRICGPSP